MSTDTAQDGKRMARCVLGTCCVPWAEDDHLDEPTFRAALRYLLAAGTRHLYIFGTAGEGHAVSEAQFDRITGVFVEEMKQGGAEPMVGIITLSLPQVLDRIERAGAMGVRSFQVSLPSWGACDRDETFRFFREVCERFPEASFLHYNLARAGRKLPISEYDGLAAAFENLVAVKHTAATAGELAALRARQSPLRWFMTEFDFAAAGLLGVDAGLLVSLASLNWVRCLAFYDAVVRRDNDTAGAMVAELRGVLERLLAAVGEGPHMDNAFDPMFLKPVLPAFPLRGLPPYRTADQQAYQRFIADLQRDLPHWLPDPAPAPAPAPDAAPLRPAGVNPQTRTGSSSRKGAGS